MIRTNDNFILNNCFMNSQNVTNFDMCRMTLLITIFLVLVNIFNTITTNIPKAEGLTAIEAFVIVCVLFVFGALMGNIFINEKNKIFLNINFLKRIIDEWAKY